MATQHLPRIKDTVDNGNLGKRTNYHQGTKSKNLPATGSWIYIDKLFKKLLVFF